MKPILKAPGVRRITNNLTPEDQAEIDAALLPDSAVALFMERAPTLACRALEFVRLRVQLAGLRRGLVGSLRLLGNALLHLADLPLKIVDALLLAVGIRRDRGKCNER